MTNGRILALDLGKASIGLCLRDDETIHRLESYIIPPDFATVQDLRPRKHAARNRKAHRHREHWFMEAIWLKAGLPDYREPETWERLKEDSLKGYASDKRLWTREFPKKSDSTCFNSALLRIQLLEGKPLADWQIWKALWSALQQRGFHYYNWKIEPIDLLGDPDEALDILVANIKDEIEVLDNQILERKQEKLALRQKKTPELDEDIATLKLQKKQLEQDPEYKELKEKVLPKLLAFKETMNSKVGESRYWYPCYLEACNMGLWKPGEGVYSSAGISSLKIKNDANGLNETEQLIPRPYRLKELKALWQQAQQQLLQLQAFDVNYFLYGETRLPYATAWVKPSDADTCELAEQYKEYRRYRGKEKYDWQGVLGQKVPRFDNRIIAKCQLLPTRNVCKANDPLNQRFSLAKQLKDDIRFTLFSSEEPKSIPNKLFKESFNLLWQAHKASASGISPSAAQKILKPVLKSLYPDVAQILFSKGKDSLKVNVSGRSRYSRPALKLMLDVLLNYEASEAKDAEQDFLEYKSRIVEKHITSQKAKTGITKEEIEKAIPRLGKTWDSFHTGDRRDEFLELALEIQHNKEKREKEIAKLINSSNNPIVRHRLTVLKNKLDELSNDDQLLSNKPTKVIIEFARGVDSGFEGKKSAEAYNKAIKANEKRNETLTLKLKENGLAVTAKNLERLKLFEEQKGLAIYPNDPHGENISLCMYSFEKLDLSSLEQYEVDHIVPMANNLHSDALWNKVLCKPEQNRSDTKGNGKGKRTPYQWLNANGENSARWQAYVSRVHALYPNPKHKKRILLTASDAEQRIESFNGLAETAYIARLTRDLMHLYFAWVDQVKGENRHVFIASGQVTAKIRNKYKLYEWLLTPQELQELNELYEKKKAIFWQSLSEKEEARIKELRKKRSNDKHHALDALCLSFSEEIKPLPDNRYVKQEWNFAIPTLEEFLKNGKAEAKLEEMYPTPLRRNTKELYPEETIYRYNDKHNAMTVRKSILAFLENDKDGKAIGKIVDQPLRHYLERKRLELTDKAAWRDFLDPERFAKANEDPQRVECRHPHFGSIVKKVEVIASELKAAPTLASDGKRVAGEYKDYGDKATKGQFKRTKQHKGQLLYRDFTGKWKVFPVCGYMKLAEARKQAQAKGQLYQDGSFFFSSVLIKLESEFKGPKNITLPLGIYKLRSIKTDSARAEIEDDKGTRYEDIPLKRLIEAGLMLKNNDLPHRLNS